MRPLPILSNFTRLLTLGAPWTPFPLAHPPEGEQDRCSPLRSHRKSHLILMTRCLLLRGRPALPIAPHHLPTYPKQPFSGLDGALQNEGTADHSAASLPLASPLYLIGSREPWSVGKGDARTSSRPGSGNWWGGPGLGNVPLVLRIADTCRLVRG